MTKTIETLEQEAREARDAMREVMLEEFGIGATMSDRILSIMIAAVKSNIANSAEKERDSVKPDAGHLISSKVGTPVTVETSPNYDNAIKSIVF